jgi:uncharacterized protein (DUF58 family)
MLGRFRWAFLGTVASFFILLGLAVQLEGVLVLAVPFLVFLFSNLYFDFRSDYDLQSERTVSPSRVSSQALVTVRLDVTNRGPSIEQIELMDEIPSCLEFVEGDRSVIAKLMPGDSISLEYKVRGRRGFAQWQRLSAHISDHLGLQRRTLPLESPGHVFVLPDFPRIYEIEIRPRQTRVYSGTVRTKLGGAGIEFFGVRGYYPGDALRHLNWKATAHHDEPITNEFEQERVADIGIILDARQRTEVSIRENSLFEYSVGAASSLADFFIARGNRVGLLVYGNFIDWTFPGYGKRQCERLLQSLARASLGDRAIFENLEYIPTRLFPAGSQLVLVSPLVEEDVEILLQLRGLYHVIAISPSPIAFELAQAARPESLALAARIETLRRAILLEQLRQAGIRVVDWDVRTDLPLPVEQALGHHTLRHGQTLRGSL